MGEVDRLAPGRTVPAKGEHVLHAGVRERGHVRVDVGTRRAEGGARAR